MLISGRMTLPNGDPLARAKISFIALHNQPVGTVRGVSADFTTDENGNYARDIAAGRYRIRISYWPARGHIVRAENLGDVDVVGIASINQLLSGGQQEPSGHLQ